MSRSDIGARRAEEVRHWSQGGYQVFGTRIQEGEQVKLASFSRVQSVL